MQLVTATARKPDPDWTFKPDLSVDPKIARALKSKEQRPEAGLCVCSTPGGCPSIGVSLDIGYMDHPSRLSST
jgi:hypothetical protein